MPLKTKSMPINWPSKVEPVEDHTEPRAEMMAMYNMSKNNCGNEQKEVGQCGSLLMRASARTSSDLRTFRTHKHDGIFVLIGIVLCGQWN